MNPSNGIIAGLVIKALTVWSGSTVMRTDLEKGVLPNARRS